MPRSTHGDRNGMHLLGMPGGLKRLKVHRRDPELIGHRACAPRARPHSPAPATALAIARTSTVRRHVGPPQQRPIAQRFQRREMAAAVTLTICAFLSLAGSKLVPAQDEARNRVAAPPPRSADLPPAAPPPSTEGTNRSARTTRGDVLLAQTAADDDSSKDEPKQGVDLYGDPLPPGAIARLGTARFRHPGWYKKVEFLPGTETFAVGTKDNTVRLYEARSGRVVREIDLAGDVLVAFRVSRDGRSIATLSTSRDIFRGEAVYRARLVVWDAATGGEIRPIRWEESVRSGSTILALSPDGRTAAVASRNGEIRIWDLPWGEERLRKSLAPGEVDCLEYSPDGETIAVGGRHGVTLWKHQTDDEPRHLDGLERPVQAVRFSPDGTVLAVGSSDSKAAQLYDVASGRLVHELAGEGKSYYREGLCFSGDGKQLFVPSSRTGTVEVFDVANGQHVRTLDAGNIEPRDASVSSDGKLLASVGSRSAMAVWDLVSGERISDLVTGHHEVPYDLAFTPDDQKVISGGLDGTIRVWDAASGQQLRVITHDRWVAGMAISPQGRWLASCGLDDTVRLWDLTTGDERYRFPGHGSSGGNGTTEVAFSPDGERFYSFGMDLYLRAYDVETGRILAEHAIRPSGMPIEETEDGQVRLAGADRFGFMEGISMEIHHAEFEPAAKRLLLGQRSQNAIYAIDLDTGQETAVVKPEGRVSAFRVSPGGELLATIEQLMDEQPLPGVDDDRRYVLRLRDLATEKVLAEATLEGSFSAKVAFSDDGSLLCVTQTDRKWTPAADQWIDVRRVETLELVARISGFREPSHAITFSHDATRIASSHADSTVMVWDIRAFAEEDVRP